MTQPLQGPKPLPKPPAPKPKRLVTLTVNDVTHEVADRPYDVLLDTIRNDLDLTGTTRGCDMGTCGCCTVRIDGVPMLSCLTLTMLADGKDIRTIENVAPMGTDLHPVQRAFASQGGSQCGFCTPGFIMTVTALLERDADPDDDTIRRAISGNMCRCTGYGKIVDAVKTAAAVLRGERTPEKPKGIPAPTGPYDKPQHPTENGA
ncbi:(2Fe-2S)-binding protein [bacterium]|nr:(2Fe-2S)-binding protein [bacterium]